MIPRTMLAGALAHVNHPTRGLMPWRKLGILLKQVLFLLTDMDKNRMEVPWFFERGVS